MTAIYALFDDGQAAERAVERVRAAGVPEGDILVLSNRPLEKSIGRRPERSARQWLVAAVGGLIGLAFGTALTTLTQTAWPLSTGWADRAVCPIPRSPLAKSSSASSARRPSRWANCSVPSAALFPFQSRD